MIAYQWITKKKHPALLSAFCHSVTLLLTTLVLYIARAELLVISTEDEIRFDCHDLGPLKGTE